MDNPGNDKNEQNVIQFQAPELEGRYSPAKMQEAFHGTSSGDQVAIGETGCLWVIGHPYFENDEFASTIASAGPARALSEAYLVYGEDIVSRLRGEFSFCLIDPEKRFLLAAVDRFCRLPLYYHTTDDHLAWSTNASGVFRHTDIDAVTNPQSVYNYMYFHMVPSPDSVYRHVNKLPAAHCIIYRDGSTKVRNYWLPKFSDSVGKKFRDSGEELKSLLRKAVSRAMGDESSVGSFLSGGLDSSSVTGMLAELSEGKAQTFSIGFSAEGYDEMPFARITAQHFGASLNEYYVTPEDVVEALPLIATSYEEPFGNSSALPAYFCARLAAQHGVKKLLAGDGGDEIFAGNARYAQQAIFERYATAPSAIRKGLIEPIVSLLPNLGSLPKKARSFVGQANVPLPDRLQSYNFLERHSPEEIFSPDFIAQVDPHVPVDLQRSVYGKPESASTQNRMLYLDWQFTLADNDLRKVTEMCHLAGVEVSYPMLDDDLVEFSARIPGNWKLNRGRLRHFYKEALRGWLPEATINKSKQGFGLPFGVWMQSHKPLQELAYESLLQLKKRHYIKPEFIDQAIEMHRTGHAAYYGELIWILMVFELWSQDSKTSAA